MDSKQSSVFILQFRRELNYANQIHFSSVIISIKKGTLHANVCILLRHKTHINMLLTFHWDCGLYIRIKDIMNIVLFPSS